jgi:hypothetical protein
MTEMTTETKFEVGKWYKRGDGELIRVVCVDAPGGYPVIGVDDGGAPWTFSFAGRRVSSYIDSRLDLIPIPIEPKKKGVVWVNVYGDKDFAFHFTKEAAERNFTPSRLARIRVDWEEGRFDE